MPRSWDTIQNRDARVLGANRPNTDALQAAVDRAPKWTVDDVVSELGGTGRDANHRLAEKMLQARGVEVNTKSLSSQMRSIQRWLAYESGVAGKQARKPSAESQKILNQIGRNAKASRDGFTVAMKGDIKVSGYRRSDRSAVIPMQGDEAAAFLENPTYEALGMAYTGDPDFAGYGDVGIDIQL